MIYIEPVKAESLTETGYRQFFSPSHELRKFLSRFLGFLTVTPRRK